jgi:hypothetical protein
MTTLREELTSGAIRNVIVLVATIGLEPAELDGVVHIVSGGRRQIDVEVWPVADREALEADGE